MDVEVSVNPNCQGSEQFVFNTLGEPRPVCGLYVREDGGDAECEVIGVDTGGRFVPAHAVKIADSGAGYAYLIYGGRWGLRIRPARFKGESWDLANPREWGEPFKIYGEESDIIYAKV